MKKISILIAAILISGLLAFAADAAGTWNIKSGGVAGAPQKLILKIVDARNLMGSVDGMPIQTAGYKNNDIWFTASRGGKNYQYKGTYTGDSLVLHETFGSENRTYNFGRSAGTVGQ
jgi:hypothetical protein